MAWQFRLLTALTDDPGLVLNIHMAALLSSIPIYGCFYILNSFRKV